MILMLMVLFQVRNMPHDNTDALQEAIKEISEDILQHPSQSQSRHVGS